MKNLMRYFNYARALSTAVALWLAAACGTAPAPQAVWLPAPQVVSGDAGYDSGVSAMYAASAGDVLIVAGGANFPDVPAADGGRKAFYDYIYVYDGGGWRCAGRLPEPAAYGVGWSYGGRMVIAGGANGNGALRKTYVIEIAGDSAVVSECRELPCAVEQAAGTSIDGRLYMVGGIAGGVPSGRLYMLDTESYDAGWSELAPLPEPFVQPVAAASGGRLYVWGGFDSASGSVGGRGYCYDPQRDEWTAVAGHPDGGTFTGGCALTLADGRILCVGGVDREIFAAALQLPAERMREYLTQPVDSYRFQRVMHIFDPAAGEWQSAGEAACTARAGASLVAFGDAVWLLGGELKPGIRTPENFYTADFR